MSNYIVPLMAGMVLVVAILGILFILLGARSVDVWQAIPPEVYAKEQPRIWRLKPSHLWVFFGVTDFCVHVFNRYQWPTLASVALIVSTVAFAAVLVWHIVWATSIKRRRAGVDARLVRFARYALWWAVAGLGIIVPVCFELLLAP